jgi:hypothetical protein
MNAVKAQILRFGFLAGARNDFFDGTKSHATWLKLEDITFRTQGNRHYRNLCTIVDIYDSVYNYQAFWASIL